MREVFSSREVHAMSSVGRVDPPPQRPASEPRLRASRAFDIRDAEAALNLLAGFGAATPDPLGFSYQPPADQNGASTPAPVLDACYRTLVEQLSAVVFTVHLDLGIGEAVVSPQIEETLGYSQQEWLEDPIRWYERIHPEEKDRWSQDAADMLATGRPLRAVYRVLARDGHVVWLQCEARLVRRENGEPWFIQGVAFDVSDLKQAEAALHDERHMLSTILDTVGALVVVLDRKGRVVRFNRACELTTGFAFEEMQGRRLDALFVLHDERDRFTRTVDHAMHAGTTAECEATWRTRAGAERRIAWTCTAVRGRDQSPELLIATGSDETERRRLQKAVLETGDQEDRRIGQDLHDGLGQHLTGIAFLSKVLEEKLAERQLPEATDATKILSMVNESISKTRELARGLLPIVSNRFGLMAALKQMASDFSELYRVGCRFESPEPMVLSDLSAATQLCRIAREAVNNAIRHGRATDVAIELSAVGDSGYLRVRDNGSGFAAAAPSDSGRGLHIMRYRASMIGGTLDIEPGGECNTSVTCVFPLHRLNEGV
jgi:PAS domain S-box-containing protein